MWLMQHPHFDASCGTYDQCMKESGRVTPAGWTAQLEEVWVEKGSVEKGWRGGGGERESLRILMVPLGE